MLRFATVLAFVGTLVLAGATAFAHEERTFDNIQMRVGWLNEPTYSGSVNAVQVDMATGGQPIADAKLSAVVLFGNKGSSTRTRPMELEPSDEKPGEYTAAFIPTRPGQYTFHITGQAAGHKIDEFFQSSDTTFDNVKDPTADEFPAKDPTAGDLAQRQDASDHQAGSAKTFALIALIVGAAGVLLALVAVARKRG